MYKMGKEAPRPAKARGANPTSTNLRGDFELPATIRRDFGRGIPGYERAKAAFFAANPEADFRAIERAMRRIAKAVGI